MGKVINEHLRKMKINITISRVNLKFIESLGDKRSRVIDDLISKERKQ